jgi:hypothetical protein
MSNAPRTWTNQKKFAPHYEAKFTPEQLSRFEEQDYKYVDGRTIKNMMLKIGVEVELTGPVNQGLIILITKDGYYERSGVSEIEVEWGTPEHSHVIGYAKCPLEFSSITIPWGISKLGTVFKMQKDNARPGEPAKMYCF